MVGGNMREADKAEQIALGDEPGEALYRSFRTALFCHTALVDDEPAAVFGLGGVMLGEEGCPWLLTTPAIEKIPVTFIKCARKEVDIMLDWRPILVNWVDNRYIAAQRFLQVLGFTLEEPAPLGRHGALFRRFWKVRDGR